MLVLSGLYSVTKNKQKFSINGREFMKSTITNSALLLVVMLIFVGCSKAVSEPDLATKKLNELYLVIFKKLITSRFAVGQRDNLNRIRTRSRYKIGLIKLVN